ncbi:MAG: hypothetical protein JRF64_09555 [Deltaproteobacteria bacterium]|nr:hypothetical protein [Deltaproteobacteria bacterium]
MKKIAVSLLALTLAVLLAAPAMAASITPYASMRLGTFWTHWDYNDKSGAAGSDEDDDLNIDLAEISRFGAKGQVGDIYGVVELGLRHSANSAGYDVTAQGAKPHYNRHVYTRLIYGKYKFNSGTLLVGQNYTPPTFPSAQQGPGAFNLQNGFISVGCLWDRRWPQIKVTLDNGFYAAAVEPFAGASVSGAPAPPAGLAAGGDYDVTLPKLFVGWDFKQDGLYLGPGFGYSQFNYDNGTTFDDTIDSWLLFLKGKAALGAVDLQFAVHYGVNITDFGILARPAASAAQLDPSGDIEDAQSWGGYIQGSFKVDPATVSIGWGYVADENDVIGNDSDEKMGLFVNCKIPIADTFFVVPEINYWDGMDDANGREDPDSWNVGVLWQMDF